MANLFAEFTIYDQGYLCLGVGYEVQDIQISLQTAMKFQDCYKMVVESLCDFSNWTKLGRKEGNILFGLLDECEWSDEEMITLHTFTPVDDDIE